MSTKLKQKCEEKVACLVFLDFLLEIKVLPEKMLLWLVTSSEWEIHRLPVCTVCGWVFRRKNHNEQRALVYECVKKWRNWKRSNWGYPNTIDSAAKVINFPISFLTIWVILTSTSTTRCGCCSKRYAEKTPAHKTTTIFRKNMKKQQNKKAGWWLNHASDKNAHQIGFIFPKFRGEILKIISVATTQISHLEP